MSTTATRGLKVRAPSPCSEYVDTNIFIVMRACEGCRRRKIKCDAATTNTWPCAACVRLKLQCIPPTVNYDRLHGGVGGLSGLERVLDFDHSSASGDEEHYGTHTSMPHVYDMTTPHNMVHTSQGPYDQGIEVYNTPPYNERDTGNNQFSYGPIPQIPITLADNQFQSSLAFQPVNSTLPQASEGNTWSNDTFPVGDLSDVLGALKIDENGIGTYLYALCLTGI